MSILNIHATLNLLNRIANICRKPREAIHKAIYVFLLLAVCVLTACNTYTIAIGSQTETVEQPTVALLTYTPKPTATSTPTITSSPIPTPTQTVSPTLLPPWIGMLYFDKNYSGEKDPDEQGLPNFSVCVDNDCATTDITGKFFIPNTTQKMQGFLRIIDPNKNTIQEMKQIIIEKEKKVIPAYNKNGVIIPEQHLNDIVVSSIENGPALTPGQIQEIGLVHLYLGVCPVNLTQNNVYISEKYIEGVHYGVDIAGPTGTHIKSPGVCKVVDLYIDTNGENGFHVECSDIPIARISLGHGDFKLNKYDTLDWYGIPINQFFNANGTPIKGTSATGATPSQNINTYPGQDLHLYMDCTGSCGFPHLHITFWSLVNNQFDAHNDPLKFLNCNNP